MLRLFRQFRAIDWVLIVVCLGLLFVQAFFDLRIPEYMSFVASLIGDSHSVDMVWDVALKMILSALGSFGASLCVGFIAAFVGAGFSRRLRSAIYYKVNSFGASEIDKFSTASLVTRSTNDVTQVRMLVTMGLQIFFKAPITATWAIVKIFGIRVEWSIAALTAVGILVIIFGIILMLVIPKFAVMQRLVDNINRIMRENLLGLTTVRAYNAESYQKQKFDKANKELVKTQIFTAEASSAMLPSMSLTLNCLTLSVFWIGAVIINNSNISVQQDIFSHMIVFSTYSVMIVQAFMQITNVFIFIPRAAVSARRINEVLRTQSSIVSGIRTDGQDGLSGNIEFRNVSFAYDDSSGNILHDISFAISKGETAAFIGGTGSGKTSIVNLITRFYDATEGEVLIDGLNVKEYDIEALYSKIGVVMQRAVMFDGTVASNVALGVGDYDDQCMGNIVDAVGIAKATEFVENKQGGYTAAIARGGSNLSGGQKQRLSIARAVFKRPEILVFDDSFSALDYKTDRAVRETLDRETSGTTRVIVAQRIGTIKSADKIFVLDRGQIVGRGTHRQLLDECDVYRQIAQSQLSEEELAI